MESAGRFKLNGFLFVHLLLPCVAAAASIDPAVEESLRQPTALPSAQNHVTDES